jgi:hypothetical protein
MYRDAVLTPILFAVAEVLAAFRATWLAFIVPIAVLAASPLLFAGRARAPRRPIISDLALCLLCEGSCIGIGAWLPFSRTASLVRLGMFVAVPAVLVLACGMYTMRRHHDGWHAGTSLLPVLVLPLAGLARNPTLLPTLCALGVAAVSWLWIRRSTAPGRSDRSAEVTTRLLASAQRNASTLAVCALGLVLILPWRFRDMATADSHGHEGQHLGWLNSMSFGKWMMADAGFTYGPLREYSLALLALIQGGLSLPHVRVAHIVMNIIGLLCLVFAMRVVSGGRPHALIVGLALLVTHSTIAYWLIYTNFGSFGWADASRAGIATLAVVMSLRSLPSPRHALHRKAWAPLAGGMLSGFAILYSHDFGVPAVLAIVAGLTLASLARSRSAPPCHRGRRLPGVPRHGLYWLGGILVVLLPFASVYALGGRFGALLHGYRWALAISRGATPMSWTGHGWPLPADRFESASGLLQTVSDGRLGTLVLDYAVGPALVIVALAHTLAALVHRTVSSRTPTIFALALFQGMLLFYADVTPDPSHTVNATTPGLVLMIALMSGGHRLDLRLGRKSIPVGALAAAIMPCLWLFDGGSSTPLRARLVRLASGEERPSFGEPYHYDLPRAGDEHIDEPLRTTAEYVRAHSSPNDPVFFTTWMLGGGAEAFLSRRENPTSFDKPDEAASKEMQAELSSQLEAHPPKLIVGNFFDYMSPATRKFIEGGWHVTQGAIRERN